LEAQYAGSRLTRGASGARPLGGRPVPCMLEEVKWNAGGPNRSDCP
jgi:hypothetical protein